MDEAYDDSYVRGELDELRDRLDELPNRWELDRTHRELGDSVDEVRRDLDARIEDVESGLQRDLEHRHDELRTAHQQDRTTLERRLRWIERQIRATGGAATTQLDPTSELTSLAQLADRGETVRAQLLDPSTRATREKAVTAWETWQSLRNDEIAAAITASRTIASTTPDHLNRYEAVHAFRAARTALDQLVARRDRVQQAAANAAAQLARDDALRQAHTAEVTAGEQAWTTLTTQLRIRLADAIDRAELLPVWFDTVLGMTPPPEADAWLQVGTELLAYRATYGVRDSVVALGPHPDTDASARRCAWHTQLTAMLRAYR